MCNVIDDMLLKSRAWPKAPWTLNETRMFIGGPRHGQVCSLEYRYWTEPPGDEHGYVRRYLNGKMVPGLWMTGWVLAPFDMPDEDVLRLVLDKMTTQQDERAA